MIDLSGVERLLEATNQFSHVDGVLSVKKAIEHGIQATNAAFVMPLLTPVNKISGGNLQEYKCIERFAVVIAIRSGGRSSSNAEFAILHDTVINALIGQKLSNADDLIEMGNGGLIPTKRNDCVFWQIEFYTTTYKRAK